MAQDPPEGKRRDGPAAPNRGRVGNRRITPSSGEKMVAVPAFSFRFSPVAEKVALSFVDRLALAWIAFFRVLLDRDAAVRLRGALGPGPKPASAPAPASASAPASAPEASALHLLTLLQRDGRLIDFLQQDVTSFSDSDVGAAARVVHAGCRAAMSTHAVIEAIRSESEGSRLTIDAGYDADRVRLIGEVRGAPPHHGVLRHRGWRVARLSLPQPVRIHDETIVAPAEVEIG